MASSLRESSLRHSKHYLQLLTRADSLLVEGGNALNKALNIFDVEWENIRTGREWAAQHSRIDDEAAWCCSAYADAGAYIFSFRLHPLERRRWLEAALAAAKRLGDRSAGPCTSVI